MEGFLYRGTCRGWPGNPSLQITRQSPTTTDPLVATLFALECSRHGDAGLHLIPIIAVQDHLGPGNIFAELEAEVAVTVSPSELALDYSKIWIPVMTARSALSDLGFELPIVIPNRNSLDSELEQRRRLSPRQIFEFNMRFVR